MSPAFADMDASIFKKLPNSTNAVESYNWLCIGATPDVLSVALMTTYKLDMAAALQYLPVTKGMSVTPKARRIRAIAQSNARAKCRWNKADDARGQKIRFW